MAQLGGWGRVFEPPVCQPFLAAEAHRKSYTMLLMEPIKLRYSEGLVRRAIWAFWWRSTGYAFFSTLSVLFALFVCLFLSGDRSWWLGALGSILGGGAIVAAALYVVHFRGSMARFRRMKSKEAILEVGDDKFRMSSDIGSTELSWTTIIKVWKFQEFWLLFYSASQFSVLPLADLELTAQVAILERVTTHGAKVA